MQFVRAANAGLGVSNQRIVQLVTALTALLLQVPTFFAGRSGA